jgi:hypothetical protein
LSAITSDPARKREYLREIEEKAEAFVQTHWQQILRLAKETLRRGRLNNDEIAAVLAVRAPRQGEGTVDGCVYRWREDGYLKPIGGRRY